MARIVYSGLVTEMKGKLNGSVLQSNKSGNIIRTRSPKRVSPTNAQSEQQRTHLGWLAAYSALTITQKGQWETFANTYDFESRFGETYPITGPNWFEAINSMRAHHGVAQTDTPPGENAPDALPSFSVITDPSDFVISLNASYNFTSNPTLIWATLFSRRATLSQQSRLRLIDSISGSTSDEISIGDSYENYFGVSLASYFSTLDDSYGIVVGLQPVSSSSYQPYQATFVLEQYADI